MATLRVRGSDDAGEASVPLSPAESLLTALLKAGEPVRHDCGGKALCGTCRVRILSDARALSPVRQRERDRLNAAGAGRDERLACQAYAARDVAVERVLPVSESGTDKTR